MDKVNKEIKDETTTTNRLLVDSLITDYFRPVIVKGYNPKTNHFHCLECGVDMGNYPGQLCRKSYCDGKLLY